MKKSIFFSLLLITFLSAIHAQKSSTIFQELDLKNPALEKVTAFYEKGDLKKARKELLHYYRSKENLYLRVDAKDKKHIKESYPEEVQTSINIAEQVRKKYFLFRYEWDMEKTNVPYQFKKEIDWLKIPGEDSEWVWMLNRHRYWIDLGKAYFLTEKEKYAKTFVQQISHWIDKNPINKKTKYRAWRRIETGIRCENWIKSFELVKNSKHVTPEFLSKFLNSLYQHGEYLNSSFSGFSQTSNWGILEFQGLFHLSLFLKEFHISATWQKSAVEKLTTCSQLQILPDGTHWEESPMYHNEVFHSLLNVCFLAQRNKVALPKTLLQKTKDMAHANIAWQKPNYHQPMLSDSDDTDLRGLLTFAAYTFEDAVLKSRSFEKVDYETYFTLGKKGNQAYNSIQAKNPKYLTKYQKSSGGLYMRTSWEENASFASLMLKKGASGHGHDNLLHFSLFANQRDYLVSSGRFTYVNNEWRKYFKMSDAKNTLGVDDLQNSVYGDTWRNTYEAWDKGAYVINKNSFAYGEGSQTGYYRLEDPVETKRHLFYLKPEVWLLFDSFTAKEEHKYATYFNFPNEKVAIANNTIETTYDHFNLKIQPLKEVDLKLIDAWHSPEYNLKRKSTRAEISKKQKGFTSLVTLLYFPEKTNVTYEKMPVYSIRNHLFTDEDVEAFRIKVDNKEYTCIVSYNSPSIRGHFFKVDNLIVRGEVVLIEKDNGNIKTHVIKE